MKKNCIICNPKYWKFHFCKKHIQIRKAIYRAINKKSAKSKKDIVHDIILHLKYINCEIKEPSIICPKCGSYDIYEQTRLTLSMISDEYFCHNEKCKHKWQIVREESKEE